MRQAGTSATAGAQISSHGQRARNIGRGNWTKNVRMMGPNRKMLRLGIQRSAAAGTGEASPDGRVARRQVGGVETDRQGGQREGAEPREPVVRPGEHEEQGDGAQEQGV